MWHFCVCGRTSPENVAISVFLWTLYPSLEPYFDFEHTWDVYMAHEEQYSDTYLFITI